MVGTPTNCVMCSRSISSRARSGSHLYMSTSLVPAATAFSMTATHPVTWNSGTTRMNEVGMGGRLGGRRHHRVGRGAAAEGHDGAEHGPVGRDRALGMAGGARRVEDGGVVVGVDGPPPAWPSRAPGRPRGDRPPAGAVRRTAPRPCGCRAVEGALGSLGPLLVGDEHLGARVLEAVDHLVGGPPRVERDGDRADRDGGHVRGDPLGVVAHADGDPVALGHAVALDEQGTDGVGLRHDVGEGEPLVLVDEEGLRRLAPASSRTGPAATEGCARRP